jgi:hypothetical protein
VYNEQGVVVGIVQKKTTGSLQGWAIGMRSLAEFLTMRAISMPMAGPTWKLHDFLLRNSSRVDLIDPLKPGNKLEDRIVTNFELLGL